MPSSEQLARLDRVRVVRRAAASAYEAIALRLTRLEANPHSVALGVAIGVFAAFVPVLGFQLGLAAVGAWLFGANVVAALLGTFIGNPLTWPLMWASSYKLGAVLLGREDIGPQVTSAIDRIGASLVAMSPDALSESSRLLLPILGAMTVGAIPVGLIAAAAAYMLARRILQAHAQD